MQLIIKDNNDSDSLLKSNTEKESSLIVSKNYDLAWALKIEKLFTAVNLVAKNITKNVYLKNNIYEKSIILLSIAQSKDQLVLEKAKELENTIMNLLSLFKVANISGEISDMNTNYILRGLESLNLWVSTQIDSKLNLSFSEDDFIFQSEDIKDTEETRSDSRFEAEAAQGQINELNNGFKFEQSTNVVKNNLIKDKNPIENFNIKDKKEFNDARATGFDSFKTKLIEYKYKNLDLNKKQEVISKSNNNLANIKISNFSERRKAILAVFKKGVFIQIRDISIRVRNCSEKTIQRELNSLVEEGVLIKIGEKRWSKYGLA